MQEGWRGTKMEADGSMAASYTYESKSGLIEAAVSRDA
jgi:hypothetical protein